MRDVITALSADPADPNKVHLFVDGKHTMALSLDVAAAQRLTVGQECPPQRLEMLHAAQEQDNIYQSALTFLSYRPRSAREVEMRLRKKGFGPDAIASVMVRLRERGYVDDHDFARFWVSNRMTFSPRGPRLLRSELRQKGVSAEVVDEVLAEHVETQQELVEQAAEINTVYGLLEDEPTEGTDLANAIALARKRSRSYGNLEPIAAKRRLSGFLARRGYGYDIIDKVLKRVLVPEEEDFDSHLHP